MRGVRSRVGFEGASLALGLWLAASVAWAQSPQGARCGDLEAQVDRGIELRRRGRDEEARRHFTELHERCPTPRVLAQVAMAEHALERWPESWAHMTAVLAATDDAWVASRRPALETLRDEILPHMARLSPTADAEGAELFVDGARVGALPLAVPHVVAPGEVRVEVRAPERRPFAQRVALAEGQWYRESLRLAPAPVDTARARRTTGYVLLGVGAAAALFGGVQWIRSSVLQGETQDATASSPGELGDWYLFQRTVYGTSPPDAETICARARTSPADDPAHAPGVVSLCDHSDVLRWTAIGAGVGGIVLAGVGAALVATSPSRRVSALRVMPALGANVGGATLEVSF